MNFVVRKGTLRLRTAEPRRGRYPHSLMVLSSSGGKLRLVKG